MAHHRSPGHKPGDRQDFAVMSVPSIAIHARLDYGLYALKMQRKGRFAK
jgi:hypothetical protein